MTAGLPLIPTTVCGSHGLPSWLLLVREAAAADRLGPIDLKEAYEDAVRLSMRDQVEAGVDCLWRLGRGLAKDVRGLYAPRCATPMRPPTPPPPPPPPPPTS